MPELLLIVIPLWATGRREEARVLAQKILDKKVKILSPVINNIKSKMRNLLNKPDSLNDSSQIIQSDMKPATTSSWQDRPTDNQFNQLVQQYDLTYETITPSKSKEMTITDKTISISELELEFILASLQKIKRSTFSIENEVFSEFPAPRLRSSEPENNENVNTACVSGHNDELTATICLDFKNGTVTNSSVSFRLPSSLYLNEV